MTTKYDYLPKEAKNYYYNEGEKAVEKRLRYRDQDIAYLRSEIEQYKKILRQNGINIVYLGKVSK